MKHDIDDLWAKMGRIYGHRWITSYGECDDGTWLWALRSLTREHLAHGIKTCVKAGKEWPPTMPEFRAMCRTLPSLTPPENKHLHLPQPQIDPERLKMHRRALLMAAGLNSDHIDETGEAARDSMALGA